MCVCVHVRVLLSHACTHVYVCVSVSVISSVCSPYSHSPLDFDSPLHTPSSPPTLPQQVAIKLFAEDVGTEGTRGVGAEEGRGGEEGEEEAVLMKDRRLSPEGVEQTNKVTYQDRVQHDHRSSSVEASRESYLTSDSSYVTPGSISNHQAPSHFDRLANQIPSYSTQVPSTGARLDASLTISNWVPRRNDLPHPSSLDHPSRVFKVIFLGKPGGCAIWHCNNPPLPLSVR